MIHKLKPHFSEKVWGGEKLKTAYHKETEITPLGESWEVSCHEEGLSFLEDKKISLKEYLKKNPQVLGKDFQNIKEFPILIKFIDAKEDLSIQVHPSDIYAKAHHMPYGKSEMWYILACDKGAGLYVGLKEDTDPIKIEQSLNDQKILELLNFFEVKEGECYYIPAGTIHAIGKGVTVIELQQSSDTTYRLYDYDRTDDHGKKRPLHIKEGLEVMSTLKYPMKYANTKMKEFPYFKYEILDVDGKLHRDFNDSFFTVSCLEGNGMINGEKIRKGDSFFVDCDTNDVIIDGKIKLFIATGVKK